MFKRKIAKMEGEMKKVFRVMLSISFVFYLFASNLFYYFLVLGSYIGTDLLHCQIKSSSNLVPFRTITTYVTAIFDGRIEIWIYQLKT